MARAPDQVSIDSQAPRLEQVERLVRGFVDQGLVPGVSLAWRLGDGPVGYHAVGALDFGAGEPVDERSIFRIFSQTKPITGVAALMLIEDGVLSLDQPIAEFLPAFAEMRVLLDGEGAATRPAARPITVRHLLTHTAGFGMGGMTLSDLYLKHGVVTGTQAGRTAAETPPPPASLKAWGERLAALPLAADPGVRFDYSVATDLLGLVVETASGIPFETFLQQRLFDPLGMVDTGFAISPDRIGRFTALREKAGEAFTLADDPKNSRYARPAYPAGGGGLLSTARDYARFAAMLLDEGEFEGVRILRPETVRLARSNLLPSGIDRVELPLGQPLPGAGYGAAMSVQMAPGAATEGMFAWPGEVPAGVFGWPGAGGTACWWDPEARFFLIFMTQYWPAWINRAMRPDVIAAAYRDLRRPPAATRETVAADAR